MLKSLLTLALFVLVHEAAHADDNLVTLARPGPWSGVSELIGYAGRIWFVNSVKFLDHNSADIYSYDPISGETRYERHLFSQDAGEPAVAGGLLYWLFEDSRFSTGRGEYMVTNGRDWQWRILPDSEVFHVHAIATHQGTLFAATSAWHAGLQRSQDGGVTWQVVYNHPTPPRSVSRIAGLNGHHIRDMAAGADALWAVSAYKGGGILWRSGDGVIWTRVQHFRDAEPLDVLVYAGKVYVGTIGPNGRGTLWGPPAPSPIESRAVAPQLTAKPRPLTSEQIRVALDNLDRVLADESTYMGQRGKLFGALLPLGLSEMSEAGAALVQRLQLPFPDFKAALFGGQLTASASKMARWYLLWAIALNGHGRISPTFLSEPWVDQPNRSEKYLHPGPAAAWAVAQLGQADDETVAALIASFDRSDYPAWFKGDLVGALTALTGERFGYDALSWQSWQKKRRTGHREAMVDIPGVRSSWVLSMASLWKTCPGTFGNGWRTGSIQNSTADRPPQTLSTIQWENVR